MFGFLRSKGKQAGNDQNFDMVDTPEKCGYTAMAQPKCYCESPGSKQLGAVSHKERERILIT